MRRAVLDTNVLVSAFLSRGGVPDRVVRQAGVTYQLVLSEDILEETEDVLHEPKIQKRGRFTEAEIDAFVNTLRAIAVVVSDIPSLLVIQDDPDDNLILACAVKAQADYLVSGDAHLKQLKAYQGIQMISPAEFLAALKSV